MPSREQQRDGSELREQSDPEGARELLLQRSHHSIQVLLREEKYADADRKQHGEPAECHLQRAPSGERRLRCGASACMREDASGQTANRAHVAFYDASHAADTAVDGDRIPANRAARIHDDVSVEHQRVSGNSSADREITAGHCHRALAGRPGGHVLIADPEAVCLRRVDTAEQTAEDENLGAQPSIQGRLVPMHGIDGLLGRRRSGEGRRG